MLRRLACSLAAAAALGLLGGCGSSNSGDASHPGLQGLILRPAKPAPALALRNYTGVPVTLSGLRGKAVLVTFVYTHCPDVCPLIVSSLAAAQHQLGSNGRRLQILAVTIDPRRDTPPAIRTFLAARDASGTMDYLLGTRPELERTWKRWDVAVSVGSGKLTNGHSAVIYGISASGRMSVVYPSDVTPAQITHDVPLLARS